MENNENRENDFVDEKEKDNVSNEENALAESKMAEGCDESKECDVSNKVVSTPSFLGWSILFSIPVVGFIASVITSFVPKRKNLKNFARATLIKTSIGLCIFAGICAIIFSFVSPIIEKISKASEGVIDTYGDLMEYIGDIDEEDFPKYFELIEKYENGEIDVDLGIKDKVEDKIDGFKDQNREDGKNPAINVIDKNVSKDADASVVIGE